MVEIAAMQTQIKYNKQLLHTCTTHSVATNTLVLGNGVMMRILAKKIFYRDKEQTFTFTAP